MTPISHEVHWLGDLLTGTVHVILWPAGEIVRPHVALCGVEPDDDEEDGEPTVDSLCAECLRRLLARVEEEPGC